MNINAAAPTAAGNTTTQTSGQVMTDTFMKLLVAQLKSQSPLDPVDPTQFVGQLAQFNQLSETVRIREILEGLSKPPSTPSSTTQSITGGQ